MLVNVKVILFAYIKTEEILSMNLKWPEVILTQGPPFTNMDK